MNKDSQEDSNIESGAIVSQILQAREETEPSVVRSKKVTVDANGNKIVQVRKRRKVYTSQREPEKKNKSSFKHVVVGLLAVLMFFLLMFGGFFVYRVSLFNSENYTKQKEREISTLWNANVTIDRLSVDGFSFFISSLVADFPETSIIKQVRINRIKGTLAPASFITGLIQGDFVHSDGVHVILRDNLPHLQIPLSKGDDVWKFKRYSSAKIKVEYDDIKNGPFVLEGEDLYIRKTQDDVHAASIIGRLHIKGWQTIYMPASAPFIYISKNGLDGVNVNGFLNEMKAGVGEESVAIKLKGKVLNGESIYTVPLKISGYNIPFEALTKGIYQNLIRFKLGSTNDIQGDSNISMTLPSRDMDFPGLKGKTEALTNIELEALPMQREIADVLSDKAFIAPHFSKGTMEILSDGKQVVLNNIHITEPAILDVKGHLKAEQSGQITGALKYGVPLLHIVRNAYNPDPLFGDTEGKKVAWVESRISGNTLIPTDNADEIKIKLEELRHRQKANEGTLRHPASIEKEDESSMPDVNGTGVSGKQGKSERLLESLLQ